MFKLFKPKKKKPAEQEPAQKGVSTKTEPAKSPYTKEEEEAIKKRLRALGYIE